MASKKRPLDQDLEIAISSDPTPKAGGASKKQSTVKRSSSGHRGSVSFKMILHTPDTIKNHIKVTPTGGNCDSKKQDEWRITAAKRAGTKPISLPTTPSSSDHHRYFAHLPPFPSSLGSALWPGKPYDQPPIFRLTPNGGRNLKIVLDCVGAYGQWYGAVQLRFPGELVAEREFEECIARADKGMLRKEVIVEGKRQSLMWLKEVESGMIWTRKRGEGQVNTVGQLLELMWSEKERRVEVEEHWRGVREDGGEEKGCECYEMAPETLPSLHENSPIKQLRDAPWNLMSKDKWQEEKEKEEVDEQIECKSSLLPGCHDSVFHCSEPGSVYNWHVEEYHAHSADYLHWGGAKIWYTVPNRNMRNLEEFIKAEYNIWNSHTDSKVTLSCPHFVRHLSIVHPEDMLPLTPEMAKHKGWRAVKWVQEPGDMIVTWPGVYHCGINRSWNINETVLVGMDNWVQEFKRYSQCLCFGDESEGNSRCLERDRIDKFVKIGRRNRRK